MEILIGYLFGVLISLIGVTINIESESFASELILRLLAAGGLIGLGVISFIAVGWPVVAGLLVGLYVFASPSENNTTTDKLDHNPV